MRLDSEVDQRRQRRSGYRGCNGRLIAAEKRMGTLWILVGMTLAPAEAVLLAATLRHPQGNISVAAATLG